MPKQKYPEPVVGAFIFSPQGKIFLMKSYKWKGVYTVPGGHVDLGEKLEDAVKREVKEETGLKVFGLKFFRFGEFIFGKQFWKKEHFIYFHFLCKTNSAKVKLSSEGQEYVWATLKEALKLPLAQHARQTIKEYIKKNELKIKRN